MSRKSCEHGVWPAGAICAICWVSRAEENDPVNHPDHYTVGGIETIDFIEAKLSPEEFAGYCKGNIIKYLSRGRHKGTEAQDYQKAQWYCARLVEAVADGGLEGNDKR